MLPHKVAKQLETIVADPEYNVTETPLPFDLILNAKNAGTTKVEYALRAARNNTLIDAEHLEFWKKQNTPAEIIEKMKDKKKKELGLSPTTESTDDWDEPNEEIDVDDIAI
jgi:ABC-type metal ion transport system substrate-binding protein